MDFFKKVKDYIESEDTQEKIKKIKDKSISTMKDIKVKTENYMEEYKAKKNAPIEENVEKSETLNQDIKPLKVKKESSKDKAVNKVTSKKDIGSKPVDKTTKEKKIVSKTKEVKSDILVSEMGLSQKVSDLLSTSGYLKKSDFANVSDETLLSIDGIGKVTVKKIRSF